MYSNKKINIVVTVLFILTAYTSNAQVQIGASYGGNYDFGKEIPKNSKSNGILNLEILYENDSRMSPFLMVGFTKVPLNYSQTLIENQGRFRTEVMNTSTTAELGIEYLVRGYSWTDLYGRFGVGINFFSNPLLMLEDSRESMGNEAEYTPGSETNFPFLDLCVKAKRELSERWIINISLGSEYYPKDNAVMLSGKIIETDVEVQSTFSRVRPYAKVGLCYIMGKM